MFTRIPALASSIRIAISAVLVFGVVLLLATQNAVRSQLGIYHPTSQLGDDLRSAEIDDPEMTVIAVDPPPQNGFALPPFVPAGDRTVGTIAATYGMIVEDFGDVRAVAPSTMIAMNDVPSQPDIYSGIDSYKAFAFLLASLSDAQWTSLLSEEGLAVSDLNTPWQRELVSQLVSSNGKLMLQPQYQPGDTWSGNEQIDETNQLPQVHLRIAGSISYSIPVKDEHNGFFSLGSGPPPPDSAARCYQVVNYGYSSDKNHGQAVYAIVSNSPKASDIDYGSPACKLSVDISSVKTIDDLLNAVRIATQLEIYVDPRLGDRKLTIVGSRHGEAVHLLKALALCVTGTYRAVGPAYVLTDDLVGIATRRQRWNEYDEDADNAIDTPLQQAESYNYTHHSLDTLSSFGSSDWFTADQLKQLQSKGAGLESYSNFQLPFSSLTLDQQQAVNRTISQAQESANAFLTTDGQIGLRPTLKVQLLVPGLDQPVNLAVNGGQVDIPLLFQNPANGARLIRYTLPALASPSTAIKKAWKKLSETPIVAAIVHPRTLAGVDADVLALEKLGVTAMWLDVYSSGAIHATPESQILGEALTRTDGTSIRVFPVLDLLYWGQNPPSAVQDLNVLGQNSAAASARWQQLNSNLPPNRGISNVYGEGAVVPDFSGVAVSAGNPDVNQTLSNVIDAISSTEGIAGIVLVNTECPGYTNYQGQQDIGRFDLGYNLDSRLAFLRAEHADPLDIFPNSSWHQYEQLSIPQTMNDYQENTKLMADWSAFRESENTKMMVELYERAEKSHLGGAPLPIVVQQRGFEGADGVFLPGQLPRSAPRYYQAWHGDASDLPHLLPIYPQTDQPRGALQPLTDRDIEFSERGMSYARMVPPHSLATKPLVHPIVLDLSDDPAGDDGNGNDPLTRLATAVSTPDAQAAQGTR